MEKGLVNKTSDKTQLDKELPSIIGESLVIFLPFLIILIIDLTEETFYHFSQTSNWSIVSSIFFGQTIIKLIRGITAREKSFNCKKFGLITSIIFVCGLVPSIYIIVSFELNGMLSDNLIILQFLWFAVSVNTFIFFGTIGHYLYTSEFLKKVKKSKKIKNERY